MRVLFLFIALVVCYACTSITEARPYAAANCIARGEKCWKSIAEKSEVCLARTEDHLQPNECVLKACEYCTRHPAHRTKPPCNNEVLGELCDYTVEEAPVPRKPSKQSAVYDQPCSWKSGDENGDIVIDLSKIPLSAGWSRVKRNSFQGIVYEKENKGANVDKPGANGIICFDVKPEVSGKYFFTALTYAKHVTEHNDVWVSSSKGFELWKEGNRHSNIKPNKWVKAYQNNGPKGIAQVLKTVDYNGYRFLVPHVSKNDDFNICISGRSYQFEMYKLIFVKCEGHFCKGSMLKGNFKRKSSTCSSYELETDAHQEIDDDDDEEEGDLE